MAASLTVHRRPELENSSEKVQALFGFLGRDGHVLTPFDACCKKPAAARRVRAMIPLPATADARADQRRLADQRQRRWSLSGNASSGKIVIRDPERSLTRETNYCARRFGAAAQPGPSARGARNTVAVTHGATLGENLFSTGD